MIIFFVLQKLLLTIMSQLRLLDFNRRDDLPVLLTFIKTQKGVDA